MQIGNGVSHIGNYYIYPNYTQTPVQPVKSIVREEPSLYSFNSLGSFNTMKAMMQRSISASNVALSVPGGVLVGYFIDLYA